MLSRTIPNLRKHIPACRNFGKKMSEIYDAETIEENPVFTPQVSNNKNQFNFNREEYPQYEKKIQLAQEQRDLIEELKTNPIPERRQRRVYDRPVVDDNIENYDVFREFSDCTLVKEYPHSLPVVCEIEISPKDFIHCFGQSLGVTRNDNYSVCEWDFTDSNLDRFLVYDYKSTTDYWGENLPQEWYAVSTFSQNLKLIIWPEKSKQTSKNEKKPINTSERIFNF